MGPRLRSPEAEVAPGRDLLPLAVPQVRCPLSRLPLLQLRPGHWLLRPPGERWFLSDGLPCPPGVHAPGHHRDVLLGLLLAGRPTPCLDLNWSLASRSRQRWGRRHRQGLGWDPPRFEPDKDKDKDKDLDLDKDKDHTYIPSL